MNIKATGRALVKISEYAKWVVVVASSQSQVFAELRNHNDK